MADCYDNKVSPIPIFSKIRNNVLELLGYQLSYPYCQAIKNYLIQQKAEEALIETLILHNNNCSDEGFASILKGISSNASLYHLHYS